jgi:hypothetical protein
MTFVKWFLYLSALGVFVWYVFFRDLSSTKITASESTKIEEVDQSEELASTPEKIINNEFTNDGDTETLEESIDSIPEDFVDVIDEPEVAFEPVVEEESIVSTSNGINLDNKYLVVVGSFGKKSNADRMLKKIIKAGHEGTITLIRGLHRVVVSSSNNEEEAEKINAAFPEAGFVLAQ